MMTRLVTRTLILLPLAGLLSAPSVRAQQPPGSTPTPTQKDAAGTKPSAPPSTVTAAIAAGVTPAPDYVIGPGDRLAIVFWREAEMSVETVVRPDGRISIPLLNDVEAIGLTPEQLREKLMTTAQRVVQDPNVTVVVKEINSRRVFITGQVAKPGPYLLTSSMNVLQLIATAGGLLEYADEKNILVMRTQNGQPSNFKFNYKDVSTGKNLKQNIDLKPGDTVVVP
jgi:polysaccharide export outer membrane protein